MTGPDSRGFHGTLILVALVVGLLMSGCSSTVHYRLFVLPDAARPTNANVLQFQNCDVFVRLSVAAHSRESIADSSYRFGITIFPNHATEEAKLDFLTAVEVTDVSLTFAGPYQAIEDFSVLRDTIWSPDKRIRRNLDFNRVTIPNDVDSVAVWMLLRHQTDRADTVDVTLVRSDGRYGVGMGPWLD